MKSLKIPEGYSTILSLKDTQKAIKIIKDTFQLSLAKELNLYRVTAPLMVESNCGVNDDLNGVERKVTFDTKEIEGSFEIVQSLAKWKRLALKRYDFAEGEGIYTDMNAIRRDDDVDNLHSIFVDQWDWERIISRENRNIEFLKEIVRKIALVVQKTHVEICKHYPALKMNTDSNVKFITSQELEDMYPSISPKQRETEITREYKTVFVMKIGGNLISGEPHDGRAPDYDDWNLNGDLLFWDDVLDCSIEITSMGIRVDEASLEQQLIISGQEDRMKFDYHKAILNEELPLTIGGGIGQSRLCMLMLHKAHIGEVSVSIWPQEMRETCLNHNIVLL